MALKDDTQDKEQFLKKGHERRRIFFMCQITKASGRASGEFVDVVRAQRRSATCTRYQSDHSQIEEYCISYSLTNPATTCSK